MRQRRVMWVFGMTAPAVAAWYSWGWPMRPVAAPASPATAQTQAGTEMSAAEYRFRHSQSHHWRALMLKR